MNKRANYSKKRERYERQRNALQYNAVKENVQFILLLIHYENC